METLTLPKGHICECNSCMDIPKLFAAGKDLLALRDNHSCACDTCIAILNSVVDAKWIVDLKEDHTCVCPACADRNMWYGAVLAGNTKKEVNEHEQDWVDRKTQEAQSRESKTLDLIGQGVFGELDAVCAECMQPNWDGYEALGVLPETYCYAIYFLKSLRRESRPPSVGAEPDGHLTLEWHRAHLKTLSVSIAPDGNLHYAAIIGPITRYGTEPIGTHASVIEDLIHQVMTA